MVYTVDGSGHTQGQTTYMGRRGRGSLCGHFILDTLNFNLRLSLVGRPGFPDQAVKGHDLRNGL